ncbi:hypothetical protein QN277_025585 [Acacia crassicarpa]|uniref:Uncharacterized protein n=1 Tax=Acacia crassicarpa TaxID=499986 RepID=A0AAE1J8C8_9FABA|nr:hypothetical protein QN277_025585 [Acacia crassicarpa]
MQDSIGIPACFSSADKFGDGGPAGAVTRSGQCVYMSIYRTRIADQCRLITITWCKNSMLHGLSVSVGGLEGGGGETSSSHTCKIELKPWYFWRKQGTKRFMVDGKTVDIYWDLKAAKFHGETEPTSEYYVAVVCDEEIVLLLGDLKKDAYRKTGCRPALIDPILVSKKEHIFGKKKFTTKAKFHDKGRNHEISIECKNKQGNSVVMNNNNGDCLNGVEPEMEIRIDGHLVIHVKHLQWKFRGNESIHLSKMRIEVYWDVHDWLFSPGLKHALFIFKPIMSSLSLSSSSSSSTTPLSSQTGSSGSLMEALGGFSGSTSSSSEFCLFLYAWKVE